MDKEMLALIIIVIVIVFIIGNFSTVHKTASKPIRKKSLNDLKETLPRTHKKKEPLTTFNTKQSINNNESTAHLTKKNSD